MDPPFPLCANVIIEWPLGLNLNEEGCDTSSSNDLIINQDTAIRKMKPSFHKNALGVPIRPSVTIIKVLPLYQRASTLGLIYNISDETIDKKGRKLCCRFNHIVISSLN